MYLQVIALVLALTFPALPLAAASQDQAPAAKAACCQMHGDHAQHGNGAGCCSEKAEKGGCQNCADGKCAECCKHGNCANGCCKDGKCTGCGKSEQGCCKEAAGCCKDKKESPKR